MMIQFLRPATLFCNEFCEVFKNTYFVEYLRTAASESVRYKVYILLSEACLAEEGEYKNYLRIIPECFNQLFVILKDNITK